MKKYDLTPTQENLLKTFDNDSVERNKDIYSFINILNHIDTSCSIALDAKWGSGKTFFVKQVKMILDSYNVFLATDSKIDCKIKSVWKRDNHQIEPELKPQVTIYYDAWSNDNDDDPMLSLIYSILDESNSVKTIGNGFDIVKMAASILKIFTGKDWHEIIDALQGDDPLSKLSKNKEIDNMISEFLGELLPERGDRLVIIIDELDRCKPTFAVKLLERIKHYFTDDRISFVFSTNLNELQATIKKLYGEQFDACRYLERFFDLIISLPKPNIERFYMNFDFDTSYYFDAMRDTIIRKYGFELREITKYLSMTDIAISSIAKDGKKRNYQFDSKILLFISAYIIPIMIGLKIADRDKYDLFVSGLDSSPLIDLSNYIALEKFNDFFTSEERNIIVSDNNTRDTVFQNKLEQIYRAIFVNDYSNNSSVSVGQEFFRNDYKHQILRIDSMLSSFADFD